VIEVEPDELHRCQHHGGHHQRPAEEVSSDTDRRPIPEQELPGHRYDASSAPLVATPDLSVPSDHVWTATVLPLGSETALLVHRADSTISARLMAPQYQAFPDPAVHALLDLESA
jgi:hypothetical protein